VYEDLRDRHHHCLLHWLLLRGLLRIHVLATRRLRGSRRLIRRLVTIRSTCKIDFIELARITPKSKFHRCTRRPWNLVTQNIEALPVNVFAINQLQHIARLNAICLVGWPTLDKAFHVHQHATTAWVNSLPVNVSKVGILQNMGLAQFQQLHQYYETLKEGKSEWQSLAGSSYQSVSCAYILIVWAFADEVFLFVAPEFDSHATELSAVRNGCRGRSCRLRHGLGHVHNLHCPSAGGRGLIILHWRC